MSSNVLLGRAVDAPTPDMPAIKVVGNETDGFCLAVSVENATAIVGNQTTLIQQNTTIINNQATIIGLLSTIADGGGIL